MGQRLSTLLNSVRDVVLRSPRHLAENVPCGRLCWRCCCYIVCCLFCCPCMCFILGRGCFRWFRARYCKAKQQTDEEKVSETDVFKQIVVLGDNRKIDGENPVEPNAAELLSTDVSTKLHNHNNYLFFMNKMKSEPRGDFIDIIHDKWWGDYSLLESHHGFIQWLFPLPEPGVNSRAQTLQQHEIEKIKASDEAKQRLLKSYEMMLDFYGIKLVDKLTGEVERSDKWKERFKNLNWNTHNNLRISRILRCLGLLGFEYLQYPLIEFFLREIILNKTLTRSKSSCFDYWISTLDGDSYDRIQEYIVQLQEQEEAQHLEEESASRTRTRQLMNRNTTQHTGNTWDSNWGEVDTSKHDNVLSSKKTDGRGDTGSEWSKPSTVVTADSDGRSGGGDDGRSGGSDGRVDGSKMNSQQVGTGTSQLTSQPAVEKLVKSSADSIELKAAGSDIKTTAAATGRERDEPLESRDVTLSTTSVAHKLEVSPGDQTERKNTTDDEQTQELQTVDTDQLTTADGQTEAGTNVTQCLQVEPTIQLSEPALHSQQGETTLQSQSEPILQSQNEPTVQSQSEPTIQSQSEVILQSQSEPTIQSQSEVILQSQNEPTIQSQSEPTVQSQSEPTLQSQSEPTVQLPSEGSNTCGELATLDETEASATHTKHQQQQQIENSIACDLLDIVNVTAADNDNRTADVETYQESLLVETDKVPVETDNGDNVAPADTTELNPTNIDSAHKTFQDDVEVTA